MFESMCFWEQQEVTEFDIDVQWSTDCGNEFVFIAGGPADHGMKYCCYCGKRIKTEEQNKIED